jgi:hypothetical protein
VTKPDRAADYLAELDRQLAAGQISQSNYDLNKARALADATRNHGSWWNAAGAAFLILLVAFCVAWVMY